ncbi:MAG TPA: NUDIX domain-containing protein, partial [Pirellulaceae bacterium]
MTTTTDLVFPETLRHRLEQPLPGRWARERFAPALSHGRHFGPSLATTRSAAVMILLCRRGDAWSLPLTKRPEGLRHHGGQISLPGGAAEAGESAEQTSRRELAEELGIDLALVHDVGRLSTSYLFISDFQVSP